MATDVGSLTDSELREQLTEYGVNVGPIVSSTRLFYEKKLGKLIDSGGHPPSQPDTEESEEEEEEEEDEEVQINYRQQHQQHIPRPDIRPQHTSTPITQQNYTPVTQARVATPTAATRRNVSGQPDTRQPAASKPKTPQSTDTESSGGGISVWIKLLFVLFVAFLIYLVIINMNPSAENKIPLTYEENV